MRKIVAVLIAAAPIFCLAERIPGPGCLKMLAGETDGLRVSRLEDRPNVPVAIKTSGATPSDPRFLLPDPEAIWTEEHLTPFLRSLAGMPHDLALRNCTEFRILHRGMPMGDVDLRVVELLVELDREQEALLELEQSEGLAIREPHFVRNVDLWAYLLGRAGRVYTKAFRSDQDPRNQYPGNKVNGSRFRPYIPGFVPSAPESVAFGAYYLTSSTTFTGPTRLRILRRAHEALPDEPNVKRALAEEEWRTAKDYEKALRLIREVIAVADPGIRGDLIGEEGRYDAALRYRREHGGG
ncbi:MAG: hypothetical protein IT207_07295 [Fimbriimonadaceae bacterium]|nr:hypothetical protein [Fimbriimonadaceae bacterium]